MTKTCATYDDVNLVMRLYELRREEKLREARAWFASSFEAKTVKEFHKLCPTGSEENSLFLAVVTYWEMAASFITADVLHDELFFETGGELYLVWETHQRYRPGVPQEPPGPHRTPQPRESRRAIRLLA